MLDGKVTQVTLVVANQARALEFYTEKVGFETKADVPLPNGGRWVTVGPKGQELEFALWEIGSYTDPAQQAWSKRWAPGTSPPIVLRVSDCTAAYEQLRGRGVEFPQPPQPHAWGTAATFRDPDGNLFSLSQPPSAWPKSP